MILAFTIHNERTFGARVLKSLMRIHIPGI